MTEKLKMQSRDIVAENIEKIREFFPNCFTEVKDEANGGGKTMFRF